MKTGTTNDLLRGMAIRLAWRPVPSRPQTRQQAPPDDENLSDARAVLLSEVDFKWLMAGQGCWIDTPRFHHDPAYALIYLEIGLQSSIHALRQCAARLQAQLGQCSDKRLPELPANELGVLSYAKAQKPLIHKCLPRRETFDSSGSTLTC